MRELIEEAPEHAVATRATGRVASSAPRSFTLRSYYNRREGARGQQAAILAQRHTGVLTDLRGYGGSAKPVAGADHAEYSKRAVAADQVAVMARLGFDTFAAVGHDRGARVVHRMCLDHPALVRRAAVLDIVPARHVFATADTAFARAYEHWFFLAQPPRLPGAAHRRRPRVDEAVPPWSLGIPSPRVTDAAVKPVTRVESRVTGGRGGPVRTRSPTRG
ncbi:alpha/beta fold hydrolase [Streptomyces sp. NPDC005483]|uniref:alpha/beta fold hydrolase n=1 Tax=Streptomyces sp. NPDC005483 TaxID=3154882 RepID=UPI00339F1EA9